MLISFSLAVRPLDFLVSTTIDIDTASMIVNIGGMKSSVAVLRECCPPVLQGRLNQANAEQLAGAFKAIADPARLRLLSFIAAQPSGEACVCHLTTPLGITQPTVSHHLKVLYDAGLLDRERRGTWVYYRIVSERLAALREALATPSTPGRQRRG
jgi:ArsR family transcriptional regulator